jgi:protein-tyrosine kinase
MLIPKASHLVERVAERLLRSGALDTSAAQLLGQKAADSSTADLSSDPLAGAIPAATATAPAAGNPLSDRSSLFAPLPGLNPPAEGVAPAPAQAASSIVQSPALQSPALQSPAFPSPPLPAQPSADAASLGQGGRPSQPAASIPAAPAAGHPADFAAPGFGAPARGPAVDPAASLLQGRSSVDAVSLERAGMVDWSRTRTRISEEFRLVQRQIIRSAFGPGAEPGFSNLLLVTSARPGEGKSFMATNLAGSIARQGDHHVLLVDADSKRDSICYSLGLAQSRGLLDLVANPKLDPAPLIVKTPIERLSILPVGRERERSAELFSTKEMTRLIQSLGRRYADRLLILDAPPCLSTSDPAVLAQVVGQILFVVEADRTQRDEIEASLDLIQACPTITLVLNKQQISSRYTFGAYSSYYSS